MLKLDGVRLIQPQVHEDHRGENVEIWNATIDYGGVEFVQDNFSVSSRNVLRGIHGDSGTWKLISCLFGRAYIVVVDPSYKWDFCTLSDKNRHQVLVPPKFGTGYLILEDDTLIHYKQSSLYGQYQQFTYQWDDPDLNIWWPISDPILSNRDGGGKANNVSVSNMLK